MIHANAIQPSEPSELTDSLIINNTFNPTLIDPDSLLQNYFLEINPSTSIAIPSKEAQLIDNNKTVQTKTPQIEGNKSGLQDTLITIRSYTRKGDPTKKFQLVEPIKPIASQVDVEKKTGMNDSIVPLPFNPTLMGIPDPKIENKKVELKPDPLSDEATASKKKSGSSDSIISISKYPKSLNKTEPIKMDTLLNMSNPFFIELVYMGLPLNFNWDLNTDFRLLYYRKKASTIVDNAYEPVKIPNQEQALAELRRYAREKITLKSAGLYVISLDKLPNPNRMKSHFIDADLSEKIQFVDDEEAFKSHRRRLIVHKEQMGPWQHKASTLAQFSQNYVSDNWHQGGNSNIAVLGILNGQMNYDNKKSIQWDNNAEWRVGVNSVSGDTLRTLNTNDDILKLSSKIGVKANGNWFYSGLVEFSTQFMNNYKEVNSPVKKASFLTPVRLNVGIGMDYKYKKIFSLMLSPVSYKYIYLHDGVNIDPNLFGIEKGKHILSEVGSSVKAVLTYSPVREIQLDSKFSFYTNYESIELDWEVVCNFTINRFMSTRLSFNPRYDNSVILAEGENAKIQFKQLMSIGFSHKFR